MEQQQQLRPWNGLLPIDSIAQNDIRKHYRRIYASDMTSIASKETDLGTDKNRNIRSLSFNSELMPFTSRVTNC